jgi:hypothetical protein
MMPSELKTEICECIKGAVARVVMYETNNATTRNFAAAEANIQLDRFVIANSICSYEVICDESNNPEDVIDDNKLILDAKFKQNPDDDWTWFTFTFGPQIMDFVEKKKKQD